jgi:3-deoxy-manno-octulosonate cytidylyltransferase (CMP-KDO synthetase)
MIEHVYARAALCASLDAVYVATCDEEIRAVVEGFGGTVIMTSAAHERASDRVAEAARSFEADIVVMIQGDEPLVTPEMIAAAIAPMLEDESVACVNLARRTLSWKEYTDLNTVKVVTNLRGDAIYFSRARIPNIVGSNGPRPRILKQVCVIPFRREALREFARLPPTPLERAESIDMLRIIEHGGSVRIVETHADTHAVDTPEDLLLVESLMENDPLVARYGERVARAGEQE